MTCPDPRTRCENPVVVPSDESRMSCPCRLAPTAVHWRARSGHHATTGELHPPRSVVAGRGGRQRGLLVRLAVDAHEVRDETGRPRRIGLQQRRVGLGRHVLATPPEVHALSLPAGVTRARLCRSRRCLPAAGCAPAGRPHASTWSRFGQPLARARLAALPPARRRWKPEGRCNGGDAEAELKEASTATAANHQQQPQEC